MFRTLQWTLKQSIIYFVTHLANDFFTHRLEALTNAGARTRIDRNHLSSAQVDFDMTHLFIGLCLLRHASRWALHFTAHNLCQMKEDKWICITMEILRYKCFSFPRKVTAGFLFFWDALYWPDYTARVQNIYNISSYAIFAKATGGGGGTRLLNWIGGAAGGGGGSKPDPVILRSAHEIYTLSQYTLLKTFQCIPCCNIVLLGYTLSDWGCWADKQAKKKKKEKKNGHRLRLDRGPVIKHYGHAILW